MYPITGQLRHHESGARRPGLTPQLPLDEYDADDSDPFSAEFLEYRVLREGQRPRLATELDRRLHP